MKKTLTAVVMLTVLAAGAAYAGSLSDPVVAPEVVMADAVDNASHAEMIIAALAVIAIILGPSL